MQRCRLAPKGSVLDQDEGAAGLFARDLEDEQATAEPKGFAGVFLEDYGDRCAMTGSYRWLFVSCGLAPPAIVVGSGQMHDESARPDDLSSTIRRPKADADLVRALPHAHGCHHAGEKSVGGLAVLMHDYRVTRAKPVPLEGHHRRANPDFW